MRLSLAIVALLSLTTSALAESRFDGLWKRAPIILPDGTLVDPYTCSAEGVEGTVLIEGNKYGDTESSCIVSNPRKVRGMDATLFDVTCRGEWGSRTERELFMLYRDTDDRDRLLIARPDSAAEFERCN